MDRRPRMERIAAYEMPRRKAVALALAAGVALGLVNAARGVEFIPRDRMTAAHAAEAGALPRVRPFLELAAKVVAALVTAVVLHEGVHALLAAVLVYRPRFGLKPPLVYVTFDVKVPRGVFAAVALAPLVALDAAFAALMLCGALPVFWHLCLIVNTIGSVGDVWVAAKLARHARGSLVRDTMTGIEVWRPRGAASSDPGR